MRILVTTIPFTGMKIEAPISKDALNERLSTGSDAETVLFTDEPKADITLTRTHGGVLVKGVISGTCRQNCSTCADLVPHPIVAQIDWILQTHSDRAAPDDQIEDPGVIVYEGEHVDLEEPLQEALILQISPFWHPPRTPDERCALCNRDCSQHLWGVDGHPPGDQASPKRGIALGTLLKNALNNRK